MGRDIQFKASPVAVAMLLYSLIVTPADASSHLHVSEVCSDVHAAAYLDEPEELTRLIEQGADVNCLDSLNQTPLITATDGASIRIIEMLLSHGAKPNIRDEIGETALAKARLKEAFFRVQGGETYRAIYKRIIRMLEDSGAVEYAGNTSQAPASGPVNP